jgi:hypothetical protein
LRLRVRAHAPTARDSTQDSCLAHDEKIVIGDFNARIGHDDNARPFIGKESLHDESNYNGGRLSNYALSQNIIMGIVPNFHIKRSKKPPGDLHME